MRSTKSNIRNKEKKKQAAHCAYLVENETKVENLLRTVGVTGEMCGKAAHLYAHSSERDWSKRKMW